MGKLAPSAQNQMCLHRENICVRESVWSFDREPSSLRHGLTARWVHPYPVFLQNQFVMSFG